MGSWSENCAISGLEIRENDEVYIATMIPNPYEPAKWIFEIPPMLGFYDGYGRVFLAEDHTAINRDFEIDFRFDPTRYASDGALPVYFNRQMVDSLGDLQTSLQIYGKTVRDVRNKQIKQIHDACIKATRVFASDDLSDILMANNLVTDAFRDNINTPMLQAQLTCLDICRNEPDRYKGSIESFLALYSRAFDIAEAAKELRRPLSPIIEGPNHDGQDALIAFSKLVLEIAEEQNLAPDEFHLIDKGERNSDGNLFKRIRYLDPMMEFQIIKLPDLSNGTHQYQIFNDDGQAIIFFYKPAQTPSGNNLIDFGPFEIKWTNEKITSVKTMTDPSDFEKQVLAELSEIHPESDVFAQIIGVIYFNIDEKPAYWQ